jgi:hypothetical protein
MEQFRNSEKDVSDELAQILLLFLPEVLGQSNVFEEILQRFPNKKDPKVTPLVLNGIFALPFAELPPNICHCICLALGRLLAATIPVRMRFQIPNEAFLGLFQRLVRSLGLTIDAFNTDDTGRRRILAVWLFEID